MNPVTSSITEEIIAAHTGALDSLAEAIKEPGVREGFKLLFRCIETWELEILVSHIGSGIEEAHLQRIQGALAAFRLTKDLLTDLVASEADKPEATENRAKRFTEALLNQASKPV